ncbi:TrbG/VirB9 family P-type conjugative transfer protein [Terasakiella sp. SH-1]|uniref:TrbG/VirB9 family P-type conjugative transfer protein n=1 Tax=Terasakiella sp. SH-1 TaxID=2560057 RepID=UPI00107316D6|nr:TrbG/VirB9 family P-type conjugative transfer protein [Terasakiella sp. SH-1]
MFKKTLLGVALSLVALDASAQTALPPIPESKVEQTKEHINGDYARMDRRKLEGGDIQSAWDEAQDREGVFNHEWCRDCTYRVLLRDYMVTAINLPKGETITAVDIGDPDNFKLLQRDKDTLVVKPIGFGGDSNLIIYGENDRIYPFYVRVEGTNSKNIPDLVYNIKGEIPKEFEVATNEQNDKTTKTQNNIKEDISDLTPSGYMKTDGDDFIQHVPFDPDKLHGWGQYKLWGAEELRPKTVYRDDHFTYIKYSKEQWAALELPTAYVVRNEIDELVNTHIKGTTYIIENTSKLITLKADSTFLCIEYLGGEE